MFHSFSLTFEENIFNELCVSIDFEHICTGRIAANLVNLKENNLVPLVRTTTNYTNPPKKFLPIHYEIVNKITNFIKSNRDFSITDLDNVSFNNAMIEVYDNRYKTMGYHTDQSLDLDKNSYICIFSCYDNPNTSDLRKLVVQNKTNNKNFEIEMSHNSVILFSVQTNSEHIHKIILEKSTGITKWLGITFRVSKTFINFIDNIPYFYLTNRVLRLANETEKKEFMKLKGQENKNVEYVYPEMDYTISVSDIVNIN